ncbi:amino acid adenylation domain protein [Thiocapsa marina 5811]|uniref:Amino acid adenylation domain protein n=2 Tax=Thiocapsa marina TaxID=244573 RepID=F9UAS7_9GAMM|nr:amino acid adenylation domain protein [Thiocapsa marina 5811]
MPIHNFTCTVPAAVTLWDMFERAAADFPDKAALVFADPAAPTSLTYRELRDRAISAAAQFEARGVGAGDIVAVIADRQLETVASYLGAMLLGAAYLPIDPRFPRDRIAYMLQDASPGLVLVDRSMEIDFAGETYRLMPESFAHDTGSIGVPESDPERPACVMYTSGSTGTPKGVVLPHRSLIRLLCDADYYEFNSGRVFLQLSALTFDVSILELFGGLLHGGQSVLFPQHGVPDLELLREVIQRYRVTTTWLTTSLFNSIVSIDPTVLSGIEAIFVGGEALSAPHIRLAQAALPNLVLFNAYGPTENHISTCYKIPRPIPDHWTSIPIGRAIAGTTTYVLNETGEPVRPGEVGELFVGGYGVAQGYLNKPELTAERFVPDPFIGEPGHLMYKTGDLVKDLGDGLLDYLGRNDTQVKIRGNRIELGEIENLLLSHPRVTDAKVRVQLDGSGDKHLVAYYLADGVDVDDLQDLLARKLPAAVVPSRVERLAYMPLNQNGKLDESRLPNPFEGDMPAPMDGHGSLMDAQLSWSTVPDLIEGLWRLVLPSGSRFSRTDSFFEVGGTSLGTLQVAARLSRELDRPIPVIKLFEFPSVDRLAAYLAGATGSSHLEAAERRAARAREARERRRGKR